MKVRKNDAISLIVHNSQVLCMVQEIINKSFLLLAGKTILQFFISFNFLTSFRNSLRQVYLQIEAV